MNERRILWARLAKALTLVAETTHSLEIERQALIDLERNGMVPSTIAPCPTQSFEKL
jgi:hypothetical protein